MDVILSVNHACNLRCTYCYTGDKFNRKMPLETAIKAIKLGLEQPDRLLRVLFFGGEPLLEHKLIREIADHARRMAAEAGKEVRFGMTTNGTLLDDERIALIKDLKLHLAVSIDGDEQAHNAARVFANGKGSYDKVVAGLQRAVKEIPSLTTISVVHPGNVDRLAESFNAIAETGVRSIHFSLNYDADWTDEALERLEAGYEALADAALERYRRGEDFALQPLHGKIISHLKEGLCETDRCRFGLGEVAVAPSGNLYACDRLIGEDGPAEADAMIGHVDTGINFKKVMSLKTRRETPRAECEGCAFIDRCTWWCGCVNKSLTGRIDGVSGLLCVVEQATIMAADRLASTLYDEKNAPFMKRYYFAAARRRALLEEQA